jgi:hypothetical protein
MRQKRDGPSFIFQLSSLFDTSLSSVLVILSTYLRERERERERENQLHIFIYIGYQALYSRYLILVFQLY